MEKTLQEIGMNCHTDKATYHHFCNFYDNFINKLRTDDIKILEIGVYHGESLKMWEEYFTIAKIYAIDIKDCSKFNNKRTITAICDQSDKIALTDVFKNEEFEIILDDGGHMMDQQQISLGIMFKRLKSKGYYILEDLHTSLLPIYLRSDSYENSTLNVLEEVKKNGIFKSKYLTAEENEYLQNNIESIEILKNNSNSITSMIIKK
jgi:hypothetical protein